MRDGVHVFGGVGKKLLVAALLAGVGAAIVGATWIASERVSAALTR